MNKSSGSGLFAEHMYRSARLHWSRIPRLVVLVVVIGVVLAHLIAQARPHNDRLDGGSVPTQASQRLMKELKDFYESDSYKNGLFTVELIDDNIYEWHVKLFVLDEENPLHRDLKMLRRRGGNDHILLHVKYNENYPDEPPFVRVVYPYLSQVLMNGSICMELLATAWNRTYTIEPLILSIAVRLSEARVRSDVDTFHELYNYEDAKAEFEVFTWGHLRDGLWTTTQAPEE